MTPIALRLLQTDGQMDGRMYATNSIISLPCYSYAVNKLTIPTLSTLLVNRSWSKLVGVNRSLSKSMIDWGWSTDQPKIVAPCWSRLIKIHVHQWIKQFRSTSINYDQLWLTRNVNSVTLMFSLSLIIYDVELWIVFYLVTEIPGSQVL